MDREKMIGDFFQLYEETFNKAIASPEAELETALHGFTSCFIVASPKGVTCSENDEQFHHKLKQGLEFYRRIGVLSMHIHHLEVESMGEWNALAKVDWNYTAVKEGNEGVSINYRVYYLLQTINNSVEVFGYVTGDEQRALKEQGIEPGFRLKD
jgi:hypothetical protein